MKKWHVASAVVAAAVVIVPTMASASTYEFLQGKDTVQQINVKEDGETRTITFSEAVNANSVVDNKNIRLRDVTANVPVTVATTVSGDTIKLTLVDTQYQENHEYELLIDSDIQNTDGESLVAGVKYVYKTVNVDETAEIPEAKPVEPEVPEVAPTEPEVKPTVPEVKPTEPEVEPENPRSFKNAEDVARSYDMGNNITYHVMKHEGAENYEVQIAINDELVGGYYSVANAPLYGYTMGEKKPALTGDFFETRKYKQFTITELIDELDGNKLLGFSYVLTNYGDSEKLREAMQLHTSPNLLAVSKVYADLATQFRAQHGKPAIEAHDVLAQAAKNHSVDMATNNYFNHKSPNGNKPVDRINAVQNMGTTYVGENIAAGQRSIFEAHVGWIGSEGHRENLLNENYTHIGYFAAYDKASDYDFYQTTTFIKLKQ